MSALVVNEIFHSIQGESTHAGRPCVFVRLTACDLRCAWCDTEYAFHEGKKLAIDEIVRRVEDFDCDLVEITGGEPLLQSNVHELIAALLERGCTVLLETGGHRDISSVDPRVHRIVDVKTPSSGESDKVLTDNFPHLRAGDELKFVVRDRVDFDWAVEMIVRHDLGSRCPLLMSPVHGALDGRELADWILASGLPLRVQLQLHKLLWPEVPRGV